MRIGARQFLKKLEKFYEPSNDASFLRRYGIATILVLLAFALRDALTPLLRDALPFTFFLTSSMLAACFAGFGPGLYALLLGWLIADYFFVLPVGSIGQYGKVESISLIAALIPSLIAIILIEFLHNARRRAKAEIARRRQIEAELIRAKEQLEDHMSILEERVAERTGELEKSVRFFENFCYSIAHDLRAPLRAMQGFVGALREDCESHFDETGKRYAQKIVDASNRMDRLVLDLLDYGSLNHQKLNLTKINVARSLGETLGKLDKEILDKRADIKIIEPLFDFQADEKLLNLILFHLLANALHFGRKDTPLRIRIWAEETGGMVRLNIQDNGIGISPEHHERIFRLFETLEPSPSVATGVGLAIVAKAIDRMNGAVRVESQRGEGSRFSIELPKTLASKGRRRPARERNLIKEFADH
jgi:signal transduction histidine kinase